MQTEDGSMRMIETKEIKTNPALLLDPKVLETGKYFKIKHCYFKISKISPEGIEAVGVSRRDYFENRR